MKKLLLVAVASAVLIMGMATSLVAQEEEEDVCPCGEDTAGDCLPCDDAE